MLGVSRRELMLNGGSAKDITGEIIAENDHPVEVEIVASGSNISYGHGPMGITIKLNTLPTNADILPWNGLPGGDIQAIKDEMAKYVQSKSISFPIQQGESVRFLANSNVDDGFYLQSGTDGKPLFEVIVNFKEMVGMPYIPDEFDNGATKSYE